MDCSSPSLPALDHLHRSHDGPVPRASLRAALLGGWAEVRLAERAAILVAHERLAAEARLGAARRRRTLTAPLCRQDVWLERLAATLAHHRAAAVRLHGQRNAYSQ